MHAIRCAVLGLTIASGGWICTAQTSSVLRSSANVRTSIDFALTDKDFTQNAFANFPPTAGSSKAGVIVTTPLQAVPRTADSKFFWLNGLHLGMAVFDVEMTQRCIDSRHCREVNPMMPSSQAGKLSLNIALVAYSSGISYWLKKHNSKVWWLPPSAGIAIHSAGVATGFEHQ